MNQNLSSENSKSDKRRGVCMNVNPQEAAL